MNKNYQKVELTANILIIIVAVLFGFVVVQKYFFSTPAIPNQSNQPNQLAQMKPEIGSKINLSGINPASQQKTLVLALQKGCHFCNESASFYKRIIKIAQNKNVRLIAVLPGGVEESTNHLNELGLTNMDVKQASLDSLQVSGTPTLILINDIR